MPGLNSVTPPVNLDFFGQLGDDLATRWRQARHPVWNAAGQVVGSYDTLDALCAGHWFLDRGAVQPPANEMYIGDFWGRRVPVATQCLRSAQANSDGQTSVTYPQPVQPGSAVQAIDDSNAAASGGDPLTPDVNSLIAPADYAGTQRLETYALWGGLALLVVLAASGGGRSRRR